MPPLSCSMAPVTSILYQSIDNERSGMKRGVSTVPMVIVLEVSGARSGLPPPELLIYGLGCMPAVKRSAGFTPCASQTAATAADCEVPLLAHGSLTTVKLVAAPPYSSPTLGARIACWNWPRNLTSWVTRQRPPPE